MSRRVRFALVASTLALGLAGPAAAQEPAAQEAAPAETISEEARIYFSNGVELISSATPNYQDAYYQFKLAYDKSGSWKVLGNLGLCAMKLERDGEAIDYYTRYLAEGGDDIDPEERQALERELLLMKGNAVDVTISTTGPEIEITDSRSGTTAPAQSYVVTNGSVKLRLRAGTHTMTANHQGKSLRWDVVLSPGKPQSHTFDFNEPEPTAAPVAPPSGPASTEPAPEPRKTGGTVRMIGFGTAGVGVLALGAGVVTGLMAKGKEDDARAECRDSITQPGTTECPSSVKADFDSASSLAGVTNVLLIGGGVLTAAGVGMIIFGGPKTEAPPSAARLELVPVVGSNLSGLVATGSF